MPAQIFETIGVVAELDQLNEKGEFPPDTATEAVPLQRPQEGEVTAAVVVIWAPEVIAVVAVFMHPLLSVTETV